MKLFHLPLLTYLFSSQRAASAALSFFTRLRRKPWMDAVRVTTPEPWRRRVSFGEVLPRLHGPSRRGLPPEVPTIGATRLRVGRHI